MVFESDLGDGALVLRPGVVSAIGAWVDRLRAERSIGVISGCSGSGKTFLLLRAAALAEKKGFRVVQLRGYGSPLGSLALAQATGREGQGRGPRSDGSLGDHAAPRAVAAQIFDGLGDDDRPILLAVDDFEGCSALDAARLDDLVHSQSRVRGVLLSVTTCTGSGYEPHVSAFLNSIRTTSTTSWWELSDIPLPEAEDFVRSRIPGGGVTSRFVRDLLRLADGKPAYLVPLLAEIASQPERFRSSILAGSDMIDATPMPGSLRDRLTSEVGRLSPPARSLLEAFAVWRLPAELDTLTLLTGDERQAIEDALDELEVAGYVRASSQSFTPRFALAQPLVARVVLDALPTLRRRRLHDGAVRALKSARVPDDEAALTVCAEHYLLSNESLDRSGEDHVLRAGRELLRRSRYGTARSILTQLTVRHEMQGTSPAPDLFVLLSDALAGSGEWDEAREALQVAVQSSSGDPALEVAALRRAATSHVALGHAREARALYERLLASRQIPRAQRVEILVAAARLHGTLGDQHAARRCFDEAREAAGHSSHPAELGAVLIADGLAKVTSGHALEGEDAIREAYALARRSGDSGLLSRAIAAVGHALCDTTSVRRGVRWLRRGLREAEAAEDYPNVSWTAARLADAYLEAGDWARAHQAVGLALHVDASLHRILSLRRSRALQSLLHAVEGRSEGLDVQLGKTYQGAEGFGGPGIFVPDLIARFEHQRLTGDTVRARETISFAYDLLSATPGWKRHLLLEVLPRLLRCAEEEAEAPSFDVSSTINDAIRDAEGLSPLLDAQVAYLRGSEAMLAGEHEDAAGRFQESARAFRTLGYRWRYANSLVDLGRASVQAGDAEQGAAAFEEAYLVLDAIGARARLDEVRDALHQLGRRAPRRRANTGSPLTRRQLEIAELAARGLTDTGIGTRLGISRRTVSTHIHHILKSLGLKSRVELHGWLEHHSKVAG